MICAAARDYAGAVADGELDLVPRDAAEHVAGCDDCAHEVEWQRAVNLALAGALAEEARLDSRAPWPLRGLSLRSAARRWRGGSLAATAVAAAVLVAVGVGAVLVSPSSKAPAAVAAPDSAMADAVHSFGAPAEYTSSDVVAVNSWATAHGAAMPAMSVPGAHCVGARTGTVAGAGGITYLYQEAAGVVEVSAMTGEVPGSWPMSETRMMNGIAVGMVHHGNRGLIVVAGDQPMLMAFISQLQ